MKVSKANLGWCWKARGHVGNLQITSIDALSAPWSSEFPRWSNCDLLVRRNEPARFQTRWQVQKTTKRAVKNYRNTQPCHRKTIPISATARHHPTSWRLLPWSCVVAIARATITTTIAPWWNCNRHQTQTEETLQFWLKHGFRRYKQNMERPWSCRVLLSQKMTSTSNINHALPGSKHFHILWALKPSGTCHRPPATTAAAAADAACGSDFKKSMPIKEHKKKNQKNPITTETAWVVWTFFEIQAFPVFAPRAFDTRWAPLSLPHQIQGANPPSVHRCDDGWLKPKDRELDAQVRPSGGLLPSHPSLRSETIFSTTNSTKLSSCPGRERATCKSNFV